MTGYGQDIVNSKEKAFSAMEVTLKNQEGDYDYRVARWVELAALLEVTARKPGNVHPLMSFADCSYVDFVLSAQAIVPVFQKISHLQVGEAVYQAIDRTQQSVRTNTNLGMVLLFVPLGCAAAQGLHFYDTADAVYLANFRSCLNSVLKSLTYKDTRDVIRGIRISNAGGLGTVAEYDIQDNPQGDLVTIMAVAQQKDLVARQYCNGFADVLEVCLPELDASIQKGLPLEEAIIRTHVYTMSQFPDSLIVRKRGEREGIEAMQRAAEVIDSDWPEGSQSHAKLDQLDSWLRAVGNQRNPGTTADLVAASLFVAFCCQVITFPHKW